MSNRNATILEERNECVYDRRKQDVYNRVKHYRNEPQVSNSFFNLYS